MFHTSYECSQGERTSPQSVLAYSTLLLLQLAVYSRLAVRLFTIITLKRPRNLSHVSTLGFCMVSFAFDTKCKANRSLQTGTCWWTQSLGEGVSGTLQTGSRGIESILLDATHADPQAKTHLKGSSADRYGSAASTSETTRKRQHDARPGRVPFDERSQKLATFTGGNIWASRARGQHLAGS